MPQSIYKKIKLEWQPILRKMENTPGMPLLDDVNQETVDSTFILATDYLKDNICSFLFKDDKKRIETWTLGTWSKCTQYSHIKNMVLIMIFLIYQAKLLGIKLMQQSKQ